MSVVGEGFKHKLLYSLKFSSAARAIKAGMSGADRCSPLTAPRNFSTGRFPLSQCAPQTCARLHSPPHIARISSCMMAEGAGGFVVKDIGVDQIV